MCRDQAPQHSKLPSRVRGLLQHLRPDMQSFIGLIGLIQPQALLDLLLGLVLAHLWCKEPHKNIHSFRPCKPGQGSREKKRILVIVRNDSEDEPPPFPPPTSEEEEEEDDPLGRSETRGPSRFRSLSAPAALPPPRRNWIRQSQTATQHDHDHRRRRGGTEERLAHLTLQRPPPPPQHGTRKGSLPFRFVPQKMQKKHVSRPEG